MLKNLAPNEGGLPSKVNKKHKLFFVGGYTS